jgi:hypothetical protein
VNEFGDCPTLGLVSDCYREKRLEKALRIIWNPINSLKSIPNKMLAADKTKKQ